MAVEKGNEVVVKFSDMLTDKLESVQDALPKTFNRTRFVQNCLSVMNEKPELMQINRNHVVAGLLKGAYLGLDFMNKECYLIPYSGSVQFQTDYKGEIKFVKNYSIRKIKDIFAKVVRDGDCFEDGIKENLPYINFKPQPFSTAEIVGAFAVVYYEDGGMMYETMSTADIQSVRNNYSKAAQSKAWKYSFDEMAKKTVLRRLCKHIETDFESVEARSAWDEGAGMEFTPVSRKDNEELVDVFSSADEVDAISVTEIEELPMPETFA